MDNATHTIDRAALKARMTDVWGHLSAEELREEAAERLEDRRILASKGSPAWSELTAEAELFNELADELDRSALIKAIAAELEPRMTGKRTRYADRLLINWNDAVVAVPAIPKTVGRFAHGKPVRVGMHVKHDGSKVLTFVPQTHDGLDLFNVLVPTD